MQNKETGAPGWALCPITLELMLDPVIAADGRTYDRVAIERLIAQHPRGPVLVPGSRTPLIHSYLIPNNTVLQMIREWSESQSELVMQKFENARLRKLIHPELDQLHQLYQLEYMPELEDDPDFPPELEKTTPDNLPRLEMTELDNLLELKQLKQEYAKLSEEFEQKKQPVSNVALNASADNFALVSTLNGNLENAADNKIYVDDKHYYVRDPRIGRVRKNPLPAELGVTGDNLTEKLQDKTFREMLLVDVTKKGYFIIEAFFDQLPKALIPSMIQMIVNAEPKLTATQARSLALSGRPGISTYFQVAIGAAHFNATRFLDYVRAGKQAEAERMLKEDPGLLTLKDVKISKLFLHMLRGESVKFCEMRKEDPDLLLFEEFDISYFLVQVSTGNLQEVERMLQGDRTLVLKKGRLVDFGLRRFIEKSDEEEAAGIYPMQYADAQDDVPMKDLLKRNWPAEQTGEIAKQLEESGNEKGNSNYKALEDLRHSIDTARDALAVFIDITKPLDTLEKYEALELQLEAAWREFIKAELKLAPRAIHLWREKGNPVAWHDVSQRAPRIEKSRSQENIAWWYDNVGSYDPDGRHKYGVVRGDVRVGGSHEAELWAGGSVGAFYEGWRFMHDLKKLSQLSAPSQAAVPKESNEGALPARRIK